MTSFIILGKFYTLPLTLWAMERSNNIKGLRKDGNRNSFWHNNRDNYLALNLNIRNVFPLGVILSVEGEYLSHVHYTYLVALSLWILPQAMFREKPHVTKRLQKDQGLRDRRTLWGKGVRLRDKGPREMSANKGTPVRYHIFWTIRLTFSPPDLGGKWGCVL